MEIAAAASTTATTLTLVRHGRTRFNALHRVQGSCDSPLTRTGRIGVLATAQHLSAHAFDAAYSSPQGRAVMTAVEIVRHHDPLVLRTDPGLRELSFGHLERRPVHEMELHHPWAEFLPAMLAGVHPGVPGGESGADFMSRVRETFGRIVTANAARRVLVVSHGLTLGAYLATLGVTDLPDLPNASVTRVEIVPDGAARLIEIGTDVAGLGPVAPRPEAVTAGVPA